MLEIELNYETEDMEEMFCEYTDMLVNLNPVFAECLKNQNYNSELEYLEDKYGLPQGRLYLARFDGKKAGCIGLRKLDDEKCEMKRLYVKPEFRGQRIAHQLIGRIIEDAKDIGYKSMFLDTMPDLKSAVKLYENYGFERIGAYYENPIDTEIYMKLEL